MCHTVDNPRNPVDIPVDVLYKYLTRLTCSEAISDYPQAAPAARTARGMTSGASVGGTSIWGDSGGLSAIVTNVTHDYAPRCMAPHARLRAGLHARACPWERGRGRYLYCASIPLAILVHTLCTLVPVYRYVSGPRCDICHTLRIATPPRCQCFSRRCNAPPLRLTNEQRP